MQQTNKQTNKQERKDGIIMAFHKLTKKLFNLFAGDI